MSSTVSALSSGFLGTRWPPWVRGSWGVWLVLMRTGAGMWKRSHLPYTLLYQGAGDIQALGGLLNFLLLPPPTLQLVQLVFTVSRRPGPWTQLLRSRNTFITFTEEVPLLHFHMSHSCWHNFVWSKLFIFPLTVLPRLDFTFRSLAIKHTEVLFVFANYHSHCYILDTKSSPLQ